MLSLTSVYVGAALTHGSPLPPVLSSTRMFEWAKNNKCVLYLQDADGDENWHIYASDLDTGVVRDMTRVLNTKTSGCLFLA